MTSNGYVQNIREASVRSFNVLLFGHSKWYIITNPLCKVRWRLVSTVKLKRMGERRTNGLWVANNNYGDCKYDDENGFCNDGDDDVWRWYVTVCRSLLFTIHRLAFNVCMWAYRFLSGIFHQSRFNAVLLNFARFFSDCIFVRPSVHS